MHLMPGGDVCGSRGGGQVRGVLPRPVRAPRRLAHVRGLGNRGVAAHALTYATPNTRADAGAHANAHGSAVARAIARTVAVAHACADARAHAGALPCWSISLRVEAQ